MHRPNNLMPVLLAITLACLFPARALAQHGGAHGGGGHSSGHSSGKSSGGSHSTSAHSGTHSTSHSIGGSHSTTRSHSATRHSATGSRSRSTHATRHIAGMGRLHHTVSSHRSSSYADTRDSNGRIVRSESARHDFMKQTGYPHGRPGYVIDHVTPLAKGGADSPSNMQWQTVAAAKAKDKWERK
jgi:hypothetical protein